MPVLYYLVGPPAVGKLTVATLLRERTGAALIDNHLVNDPVFVPLGADGIRPLPEGFGPLRERVIDVVHEAIALAAADIDHILTNWLDDSPTDAAFLDRIRALAAKRGARLVLVWLSASPDTLLERVTSEDRRRRAKLRDPQLLRHALASGTLPAPPDAIEIDTTDLSPTTTVDRVLEFAGRS